MKKLDTLFKVIRNGGMVSKRSMMSYMHGRSNTLVKKCFLKPLGYSCKVYQKFLLCKTFNYIHRINLTNKTKIIKGMLQTDKAIFFLVRMDLIFRLRMEQIIRVVNLVTTCLLMIIIRMDLISRDQMEQIIQVISLETMYLL